MHINKFKKVGKNKYKIFLDTTELNLYEDIILKYDLLLKKDISLEEIDKLINENSYYDAYNMALNYIEIKLRNRKEIVEYLKKKDFNSNCIDYALEKLDKLGKHISSFAIIIANVFSLFGATLVIGYFLVMMDLLKLESL